MTQNVANKFYRDSISATYSSLTKKHINLTLRLVGNHNAKNSQTSRRTMFITDRITANRHVFEVVAVVFTPAAVLTMTDVFFISVAVQIVQPNRARAPIVPTFHGSANSPVCMQATTIQ